MPPRPNFPFTGSNNISPFYLFLPFGNPQKTFLVPGMLVTCCRLSLIRPSVAVLCWPCFCVAYFLLCPRSLSLKDRRSCQSTLLSPRLLLLQQHLPPSPAVAVYRVYSAPADAVFRVYAAVASWSLSLALAIFSDPSGDTCCGCPHCCWLSLPVSRRPTVEVTPESPDGRPFSYKPGMTKFNISIGHGFCSKKTKPSEKR